MYKIDGEEIREIDGPKQAFFVVPGLGSEKTEFEYSTLAKGFFIEDGCDIERLISMLWNSIRGAVENLLSSFNKDPAIVWGEIPAISVEQGGTRCKISCRLAIIQHKDVDRVFDYLSEPVMEPNNG